MRKLITMMMALLVTGLAQAQKLKESEVPKAVKDSFTQRFANVKGVEWSKEGASEFEAEFKIKGAEQSANFDETGKWLETETEIKKADLPKVVQDVIAQEFTGYKIEEAEKVETAADGTQYEVELEKGKVSFEVLLSSAGKVLKKEEEKDEDHDKE